MSQRYINIPKHPGVRKNVVTGRYQSKKKIRGRQYAETFDSIRDAIHWKNTFDGTEVAVKAAGTSTLRDCHKITDATFSSSSDLG